MTTSDSTSALLDASASDRAPEPGLVSKVAAVTLAFWVMKVLATTLGETAGDFLTDNLGLSYVEDALVTAGVITVVLALHYLTRLNAVLLFWIAFIFTRPFGATFGLHAHYFTDVAGSFVLGALWLVAGLTLLRLFRARSARRSAARRS